MVMNILIIEADEHESIWALINMAAQELNSLTYYDHKCVGQVFYGLLTN